MRLFTGSILSLAFALSACGQPYRVAIHSGVAVSMRDGVKLVADIYQPETEGKFPVLLERTPYNRAGGAGSASAMAAHGYIVIIQDTRGRFDSQGEFYPFRYESQDGYDTVEWAAKLPYADGKVGMFGGSYVGATQMLAAPAASQRRRGGRKPAFRRRQGGNFRGLLGGPEEEPPPHGSPPPPGGLP